MKLDHDLHMHTYLSACCKDKENHTPANILSLAEEMGVHTIGFSDHIWANPAIAPSGWYRPQDVQQIARLRADLAKITTPVRVLVGCEADMIAPGKFGITHEIAQELDFVLLACSHFHMKEFVTQPKGDTPQDLAAHMLAFFISGVTSGLATSIAHPFLPVGSFDRFDSAVAAISDATFQEAFGTAAEHGVAIEITRHFIPAGQDSAFSMETPVRFLSIAKQAGCTFTLGTDAHRPDDQKGLPTLAPLIKAVGITEEELLPMLRVTR